MFSATVAARKLALLSLLLFFSASTALGQNLVRNGSFEEGSPIAEPPGFVRIDPFQIGGGATAPEDALSPGAPFAHVLPWHVLSSQFADHAVDRHVGLSNTPNGTKAIDLHPQFMSNNPACYGPDALISAICQDIHINGSLVQYLIPTIPGEEYFLSFWYALPYEVLPDDTVVPQIPDEPFPTVNGGPVIPSLLNVDVAGFGCFSAICGPDAPSEALAAGPVELDPQDPAIPTFFDQVFYESAFNWTMPSDYFFFTGPEAPPEALTFATQWANQPAVASPLENLVWTKINLSFVANSFSSRVRFRMFYPPDLGPCSGAAGQLCAPVVGGEDPEPTPPILPFWYFLDDDFGWLIDDVELFPQGDINEDGRLDSKYDVIGDLQEAIWEAGCPIGVQLDLGRVIALVAESLNPIFWADPATYQLNNENGRRVFDLEFLAAELLEDTETSHGVLPDDCLEAIARAKQRLMDADYVIVRFELDRARAACTFGPCLEDLAFAARLLRDADRWWIGHDLKWAIDKYGDAWEAAIRALLGGGFDEEGAESLAGEGTSSWGGPPQAGSESISTASENDVTLPETVVLESNYPNPFNPTTTIRFGLPASSDVSLAVYDLMGREVARLANGVLSAGYHEVSFDARDLPSGLYVYRLTAGSAALSGRMMLVK